MILRFPMNNESQGTLTIGEAPLTQPDFSIPLQGCSQRPHDCKDTWNVQLESIRLLGNLQITYRPSLPTIITTEAFWLDIMLGLPSRAVNYLRGYMQAQPEADSAIASIDCSRRHTLPDIVLEFYGYALILSWENYTIEDSEVGECFMKVVETGPRQQPYIGMGLLKKFDVMFDMDRNVVGFRSIGSSTDSR